jgi:hypothetical protein
MDENSESLSVPEGALLEIANRILNLLDYPSELENEEDLFLDDFYIAIVGNLINDTKFDLKPGRDNEEKVQSLKKLLKLLQEIIEMDLSHINPEAIIYKHDRISTKSLLELIEELIKALINENEKEENEESDSIRVKNRKIEEIEQEEISNSNLDSIQQKQNISDGNINKYNMNITDEDMRFNKEIIEDDDDDSIEDLSAKMQKIKESSKKNNNNINNNNNNNNINNKNSNNNTNSNNSKNKNNIEISNEKKTEKKEEIKEEEINKIETSSNKKK